MSKQYDLTVVITTYNRSEMLRAALESVLCQESKGVRYEVIVVDNNSSDSTREVIQSYHSAGHQGLRYIFEPKQGSSHARNAGIAAASSDIIAFADDDVRVAKNWVFTIKRAFDEHPDVGCIGGKVLPIWNTRRPNWLTRDHWAPLALQDYGNRVLAIGLKNRLCLVSANLAIRRAVFVDIGTFAPELQRVKDGIGSMEDAELIERYWHTGRECLYLPELVVETEVPSERMTKAYHRRWHRGHGYFHAIKRSVEIDVGSIRLFDVPGHLYKQAIIDAASWLMFLPAESGRAFSCVARLNFFLSFFRKRRADYIATAYRGFLREIVNLVRYEKSLR